MKQSKSFVLSLPETLLSEEDVLVSLKGFGENLQPLIHFETVLDTSLIIYFHRPTRGFYFKVGGLFSEGKSLVYTKKWVYKNRKYVKKYHSDTPDLGIRPWSRWDIFWFQNLYGTSSENISGFWFVCILGFMALFTLSAFTLAFTTIKTLLLGWGVVLGVFYWWLFIE